MSTVTPVRPAPASTGDDPARALLADLAEGRPGLWRTHTVDPVAGYLTKADMTHLYLRLVPDPTLREALTVFDQALSSVRRLVEGFPVSPLLAALREAARTAAVDSAPPTDVVDAVGWASRVSGLPVVDVLAAAAIKERTFHDWKRHGRRPRLSSQGRLWLVLHGLEDLRGDLGSTEVLQRWLTSAPERRELFRTGELDRLRTLLIDKGGRVESRSPGGVFALGDDADPPLPSAGGKTVPRRGVPSRRTTRASAGRRAQ